MLAAVCDGDAKKLAELMRQDPGFKVNMNRNEKGWTLLHYACFERWRSPVIPVLLAHPDIDVNLKEGDHGASPFYFACRHGRTPCVREMLKDSRVKVNEPEDEGRTPLWFAAIRGHLNVIEWWIASGREMNLGRPGEWGTDVIGVARRNGTTGAAILLERFKENPVKTRQTMRVKLGLVDEQAAEMFALVVFVSDGLLQVEDTTTTTPAARFFSIVARLPLELQMVLCYRLVGSYKEIISGKESEVAFKELARKLW